MGLVRVFRFFTRPRLEVLSTRGWHCIGGSADGHIPHRCWSSHHGILLSLLLAKQDCGDMQLHILVRFPIVFLSD